jgi:hypothetical protein
VHINNSITGRKAFATILIVACILLCLVIFSLCAAYILSSHHALVSWYKGLNNCFYLNSSWGSDFFTPHIKSDGNMYCVIGMAIVLAGTYYFLRQLKAILYRAQNPGKEGQFKLDWKNLTPLILCLFTVFFLWYWGNSMSLPAYDEVFSAQNIAGIHPFQAVSYYMLPNNHLFFNLVNNLFFSSFQDKVATGRVISLFAYVGFSIALFYWFKKLVKNRWVAFIISATLGTQFLVWGFGFQARGYEVYLLAHWGLYISLLYYIVSSRTVWLYLNVACIAAGYFCLPSFLYVHITQVVFFVLYQLLYKRKESAFWKWQLVGMLLTYLCYLPALCFTGLESIVHNKWVGPMNFKTSLAFSQWMFPDFSIYISHIFSDLRFGSFSPTLILFLLPLALLFGKKNILCRLSGLFYVCMWTTYFLIVIGMKRPPFERNLLGQYSITLAAFVLTLFWAFEILAGLIKLDILKWALFIPVILLLCYHFLSTDTMFLKEMLYEYPVNGRYDFISTGLDYIPPGSTVALSDEGFYYGYICMKHGCKIAKCPTGNETYFVKPCFENMPPGIAEKYTLVKTVNDFAIYKRN